MKRTPLRRRTPLTSTPYPLARARLAPRSQRTIETAPDRAVVRDFVFARDRACVLGPYLGFRQCSNDLTFHHLRKAGQGGGYTARNGVALCATMNTWVEDNPRAAWRLGLVCRAGETLSECWCRMQAAGLVFYGPDGEAIAPTGPPT